MEKYLEEEDLGSSVGIGIDTGQFGEL